jgi:hypothetical protein
MPVSKARSDAARANGAKSRGPVTAAGKARSAGNSRRHGILSTHFTLGTEEHEVLSTLHQEYIEEWQPEGPTERDLVAEIALCRFRQSRIAVVEVAAWDLQMDKDVPEIESEFTEPPDNAVRTAIAFQNLANNTRILDLTNRYETRFHRQFMRALNELKDLQDRRLGAPGRRAPAPPADTVLPNEPKPAPQPAPVPPVAALPNEPERSAAPPKLPNEPNPPADPDPALFRVILPPGMRLSPGDDLQITLVT